MIDKKAAARELLKERMAKKRFKLSEGTTTFRVLPNPAGEESQDYVDYGMHSEVGPRKAYMRCGKKKNGTGSCFLCDTIIPKLEKSNKSIKHQAAERMARRDVFAVQIIYKTQDSEKWLGPALWEMPQSLANSLLGIMGSRDIVDPKKGYNLNVMRSGTGMRDTKYGSLEREEDKSAIPEGILQRLRPFREVIKRYDEAQLKSAYFGHEQEEDEEEEDEEELEGKKKPVEDEDEEEETPKSKKKPVEDEDEEDEEDEKPKGKKKPVEDEDEEEDEKPKGKKAPVEDEDEEETEDEEDEKPKSKKKPVEDEDEEEEDEKPKDKKKSKDEDEDEEESDEFPDLEDDEDEKPKSKKKSKDEDEDEDEEEEDEKPKSKKKSKEEDEEDEED